MSARGGPYLLDITRLMARIGRGPLTGVDRVELAYLRHLGALAGTLLLARTAYGYLILPGTVCNALESWMASPETLPKARLLDRLRRRGMLARVEAGLRGLAIARGLHGRLGALVARVMPRGGSYLNVGHSNLSEAALRRIKTGSNIGVFMLIHDTIPLDHPEFSRPGEPEKFREKLASVARHADLVICPSEAARADVRRWCGTLGRVPESLVAPLGIEMPQPGRPPEGVDLSPPYFVALGTIEPRKNHALLLDVWERLAANPGLVPRLIVMGNRGWASEALFARLAAAGPQVQVLSGLDDGAALALLKGARALLMPSRAEGFGLPVAEAMALGVPVIASDLPVYREFAGDYPVYLSPDDAYSWTRAILAQPVPRQAEESGALPLFSWPEHFNLVLNQP